MNADILTAIAALVVSLGTFIGGMVTIHKTKQEIIKEKAAAAREEAALSTDIINQAKEWLAQQGVYIDELTEDAVSAREEAKSLRKEMEQLKKDQEKMIEEQAKRERAYQSYTRYLLCSIKELTQQICDLGQAPVLIPIPFEEYTGEG